MKSCYSCIHRPVEDGFECQYVFNPQNYECQHCFYRTERQMNLVPTTIKSVLIDRRIDYGALGDGGYDDSFRPEAVLINPPYLELEEDGKIVKTKNIPEQATHLLVSKRDITFLEEYLPPEIVVGKEYLLYHFILYVKLKKYTYNTCPYTQ